VVIDDAQPGTAAPFAQIEQQRAHEYVADQIRRHIGLRLIAPGDALPPERELARTFGVGRATVQHAMRLLEADRLVDTRRGRGGGTFVVGPAHDAVAMDRLVLKLRRCAPEIEDAVECRRTLEPAVTAIAAEKRRRADVTLLRRAARGLGEAGDEAELMRWDTEFHLTIARATRNRLFVASLEHVRLLLNDALSVLPESDLWHERIFQEHDRIIEAISAQRPEAASAAMRHHVKNAEMGLRAALAAVRR
jgi:GntR family transcriptional regulator, transcriptional repressor for pyruvate dehydrogenase complex